MGSERRVIEELLPHRDPFLLVDRIVEQQGDSIVCEWRVPEDLDCLRGHYPGEPVLPGVMLCEFTFQTGALLIYATATPAENLPAGIPVLAKIENARFRKIVRPGETLRAEVRLVEKMANARLCEGRVSSDGKNVLRIAFTLAETTPEVQAWSGDLGLRGRKIVVTGVANKKSVAFHVGRALEESGATPVYVVHTDERRAEFLPHLGARDVYVCDVQHQDQIERLALDLARDHPTLDGLVHSIAFANYSGGQTAFHETRRADFLQAIDVSCFSFVALSNGLKELFQPGASVVTISISTTAMAAENYGYMAPVKAALDSAVVFLAKSFSRFSDVRFNAVRAGLLKTKASAGIPGYLDSYLFGEEATLRKRGVTTREVADTALFLLSPVSSGINAQGIVVDAGMGVNYFDEQLVQSAAPTTASDPGEA